MKRKVFRLSMIALVVAALVAQLWWPTPERHLREGDIVFRGAGWGVASLTASKWTHCGILHNEGGQWVVYEAVGPVRKTPLRQWKRRGHAPYFFRVVRLRGGLCEKEQQRILSRLNAYLGTRYDRSFRWSDDRVYCSELVWKAYKAAGIELSRPRRADTFLAYHLLPRSKRKQLINRKGLSLSDPMVPPCDLCHSRRVRRVW